MGLTTKYPGKNYVIADNPELIVFGTAMIGDTFGEVESISVSRDAELNEIKKHGSLLAAIMSNASFLMTMKTIFTADVDPPGLGELVTFPLTSIQGRIIPSIDVDWEAEGQRMLALKVKSWDSLTTHEGGGSAIITDGITSEPLI